jgi:hypothetical protein
VCSSDLSSAEEMFEKEKELVKIGPHSYNLKSGGFGGFDYINKKLTSQDRKRIGKLGNIALQKRLKEEPEFKKWFIERNRENTKRLHQEGKIKKWSETYSWLGKKHKDETKLKMSNSHQGKHDGEKNTQYGTMWITNGFENKKIKKQENIPEGWNKGRVIKN